eukprot:10056304-Alexandrium_andersonii.AAC.1
MALWTRVCGRPSVGALATVGSRGGSGRVLRLRLRCPTLPSLGATEQGPPRGNTSSRLRTRGLACRPPSARSIELN